LGKKNLSSLAQPRGDGGEKQKKKHIVTIGAGTAGLLAE